MGDKRGMQRLIEAKRVYTGGATLAYKCDEDDFPCLPLSNLWGDTVVGIGPEKFTLVQTAQNSTTVHSHDHRTRRLRS